MVQYLQKIKNHQNAPEMNHSRIVWEGVEMLYESHLKIPIFFWVNSFELEKSNINRQENLVSSNVHSFHIYL